MLGDHPPQYVTGSRGRGTREGERPADRLPVQLQHPVGRRGVDRGVRAEGLVRPCTDRVVVGTNGPRLDLNLGERNGRRTRGRDTGPAADVEIEAPYRRVLLLPLASEHPG